MISELLSVSAGELALSSSAANLSSSQSSRCDAAARGDSIPAWASSESDITYPCAAQRLRPAAGDYRYAAISAFTWCIEHGLWYNARKPSTLVPGGVVSTYQHYEFHAIDRLLTGEEQQAVARLSSRVDPHPRQAVFTYNWSGFPGSPRDVLTRYYDALFYTASWGSRQIMFCFPKSALDLQGAGAYCRPLIVEDYVSLSTAGEYIVLDIGFDDEGEGRWFEFEGELATMLGLRDDILRGDYRALYLAWLKVLEVEDLLESVIEPPVPLGLRTLSPALHALVDFLEIDGMLIQVAAEASGDPEPPLDGWLESALSQLPARVRDSFLLRLARGEPQLSAALNWRLREISFLPEVAVPPRRTVGWLLKEAEARRERDRQRRAAEAEARRIWELEALAKREDEVWADVESLIERMQARPYDEAVNQMVRLRDLAEYQGEEEAFQCRIDQICERYSRRPGLLGRMRDASLSPTAERKDV